MPVHVSGFAQSSSLFDMMTAFLQQMYEDLLPALEHASEGTAIARIEAEFEREMEKFLGVGSVKVNRNDENKQQTTAIPSGPNVGKSPPPAFAAQSIAFKMMRKGKDGKREKVDIALPETASFAMEAKKRQIMEAEELSEVRRLTLQRTADMQEEAISLEKQNKEGGINSMSWRKKKSSGDADQDGESKKDSFWNAHRRL